MGVAGRGEGDAVELSVDVAARPETVWRCVTEEALLSRWLSAGVSLEPRVGGAVRIDFARHGTVVEGVVEEVRPGERLVFSWGVGSGPQRAAMPPGSTRVRISLERTASGTRVTLRHEGLPSEKERRDHAMGWNGYLGSLAGVAPLAAVEGGPEALWDRWCEAWGETDAARRGAVLARCVSDDVAFRDLHAEGSGREWLSQWIGGCQAMFPGTRILRDGPVLHTRGSMLARWRCEAGGAVVARGVNHGRLSGDGRLAAVEGFWEAAG